MVRRPASIELPRRRKSSVLKNPAPFHSLLEQQRKRFGLLIGFAQVSAENECAFVFLAEQLHRDLRQEIAAGCRIDRRFQIAAGAAHDAPQQRIEAFAVVREQPILELNSSDRWRQLFKTLGVELPAGVAGIEAATDAVECRIFKSGRQWVADVLPAIADIIGGNSRIASGDFQAMAGSKPRAGLCPAAEHAVVPVRENVQKVPCLDRVKLHWSGRRQQHALGPRANLP